MESGASICTTPSPVPDQRARQIERILQSTVFRNASTLQQLLQFLAARALSDPQQEPLKEYTIGVEAFGRSSDFDPKTDTIVRVQTHRLRQKLKEYYDTEGSRDPLRIDIPKGHYLPRFEQLEEPEAVAPASTPISVPAPPAASPLRPAFTRRWPRLRRWQQFTLAGVAALGCFALGVWAGAALHRTRSAPRTLADYAVGSDSAKAFWANLIGDDRTPVIAYPDAVFLLDESNDLFSYSQGAIDDRGSLVDPHLAEKFAANPALVAKAGALYYENGYTGTGELQAVAMITALFGQMGVQPIIKPSRDITPVDLRQHSVILLGSCFQNVAVAQLMSTGDFIYKNPDARLQAWRAEILNPQPHPGEERSYHTERDPVTRTLRTDFGIISVQPGVVPGRHIAVLGGLDTTGTEGAAIFATSESGAEELLKAAAISPGKRQPADMQPFQVLLRVKLEKGYEALGVSMIASHRIPQGHKPAAQ